MSIPILELPQDFGWGTPYKALYKYFISNQTSYLGTPYSIGRHKIGRLCYLRMELGKPKEHGHIQSWIIATRIIRNK